MFKTMMSALTVNPFAETPSAFAQVCNPFKLSPSPFTLIPSQFTLVSNAIGMTPQPIHPEVSKGEQLPEYNCRPGSASATFGNSVMLTEEGAKK